MVWVVGFVVVVVVVGWLEWVVWCISGFRFVFCLSWGNGRVFVVWGEEW